MPSTVHSQGGKRTHKVGTLTCPQMKLIVLPRFANRDGWWETKEGRKGCHQNSPTPSTLDKARPQHHQFTTQRCTTAIKLAERAFSLCDVLQD